MSKQPKRPPELQSLLDEYHDAKVLVTQVSAYRIKQYLNGKLREMNIPFSGIDLEECSSTDDGQNVWTFGAKISISKGNYGFESIPENWVQSVLDCLGYDMNKCAIWTRKREFPEDKIEYETLTLEVLVL